MVRLSNDVVLRSLGDESVVLHLKTGTYLHLNDVANAALELIEGGVAADPETLAHHLQEFYDVERDVLVRDLQQLLTELEAAAVLVDP